MLPRVGSNFCRCRTAIANRSERSSFVVQVYCFPPLFVSRGLPKLQPKEQAPLFLAFAFTPPRTPPIFIRECSRVRFQLDCNPSAYRLRGLIPYAPTICAKGLLALQLERLAVAIISSFHAYAPSGSPFF